MFRTILTPPPNMRLDNIPPVHEWHLTIRLDPHLVSRMRRNHLQRRDVNAKLPGLGELAHADPQRQEVAPGNRSGQIGYRQAKIVDATAVKTEDITVIGGGIVGTRDQGVEGAAGVVGQFSKEGFGLVLC